MLVLYPPKQLVKSLKEFCSLTKLNLTGCLIGVEGVKDLAQALQENTTLKQLNLKHNFVYDEGIKYLSEALILNTTLQDLCLTDNFFGAEGFKYLSEALLKNSVLTRLDISGNYLTMASCQYVARLLEGNRSITSLDIGYSGMISEGFELIVGALKTNCAVKMLDISCNPLDSFEQISTLILSNSTLTSLVLNEYEFSDQGYKRKNTSNRHINVDTAKKYIEEAININITLNGLENNIICGPAHLQQTIEELMVLLSSYKVSKEISQYIILLYPRICKLLIYKTMKAVLSKKIQM
uniref:Uncharacterized protein n=1 Tax=Arcella intermedia TaxID=1963864 RepID=A0A6B2LBJ6_9EUKA